MTLSATALAVLPPGASLSELRLNESIQAHVPPEEFLEQIVECTERLRTCATIPMLQKVMARASAIEAIAKQMQASKECQLAAARLVLDAEIQLGHITKLYPPGPRGAKASRALKNGETFPSRRKDLKEHGISLTRANQAQKLAEAPPAKIDEAFAIRPSMSGVKAHLGIRPDFRYPDSQHAKNLAFLADEAISLLEKMLSDGKLPPEKTVQEYRKRWFSLTGKNL